MAKKVGTLIKEARTAAGMTQEQLARKVKGLSAADLGKAERGEKDLTQEQLKAIAKATGVTQKSLLEAAKGKSSSSSSSSSKKKTGSSSSSSSSKKKTSSSSSTAVKLTADEKKLLTLYLKADDSQKEAALEALQGESGGGSILGSILETAIGILSQKDRSMEDPESGE
jgi:transcriptional regulator with XRE-family HTH domain